MVTYFVSSELPKEKIITIIIIIIAIILSFALCTIPPSDKATIMLQSSKNKDSGVVIHFCKLLCCKNIVTQTFSPPLMAHMHNTHKKESHN